MRKNQNGVSMISLVITIIVIIILAAVTMSNSTDTITKANFSTFSSNVGEVRSTFTTVAATLKGTEGQNGIVRSDAQVFNYLARNGSGEDDWLARGIASEVACTKLENAIAKDKLSMEALPPIKVNTAAGTGVTSSYFVTKAGVVFIWPPYEYDNKLYINETMYLLSGDGVTGLTFDEAVDAGAYGESYELKINNETIWIGTGDPTNVDVSGATPYVAANAEHPDIHFEDMKKAAAPTGHTFNAGATAEPEG